MRETTATTTGVRMSKVYVTPIMLRVRRPSRTLTPVKWPPVVQLLLVLALAGSAQEKELPREWVDPDTGHRVVRLSEEGGSQSLYFHQNAYTPDGRTLVITTPTGLAAIDLKTHGLRKIISERVNLIMVGRKTGQAYYVKAGRIFAVDVNTKSVREIGTIPAGGSIASVNSDETLLAGTVTNGTPPLAAGRGDNYPGKGD